jgi:hypothetical protein
MGGTEDVVDGGPVPFCLAANDLRCSVSSCNVRSRTGRRTLSSFLINFTSSRNATSMLTPSLAEHSMNGADNDFAISRPSNCPTCLNLAKSHLSLAIYLTRVKGHTLLLATTHGTY